MGCSAGHPVAEWVGGDFFAGSKRIFPGGSRGLERSNRLGVVFGMPAGAESAERCVSGARVGRQDENLGRSRSTGALLAARGGSGH